MINFSAGFGDALLLGFGDDLREALDIDGGVDKCSDSYINSGYFGIAASALTGAVARVSYVVAARAIPSATTSAKHAVHLRNSLKFSHRRPFNWLLGKWHTSSYQSLSATKTESQIISGAGRTNNYWTGGIIGSSVLLGGARAANQ